MAFIQLRNIGKTYALGGIETQVLQEVTLEIGRGEFVALMGSSGSGKTTLMNVLGCLDRPSCGRYMLDGRDVTAMSPQDRAFLRNQKLGFVFQTFNLLPRTSVLDNVLMPLAYSPSSGSRPEARSRAESLLRRVGLGSHLHHQPSQLSGGQQQRVAIARALINEPALLLADEPTGNLDSRTTEEVLKIFQELNREGVTILLVTHDEAVASHAGRIVRIRDGIVEPEGPPRSRAGAAAPADAPVPRPHSTGGGHPFLSSLLGMRRMLQTALTGLLRNTMRAALTTLGIVIGVAAVITMMEIGRGSSSSIQKTIAGMGANNLLILPGAAASGGASHGSG